MGFCKTLAAAAICVATISTGADAWWCTGHMIIAEIARVNLNAGVEADVNAVIADLKEWGPFPMLTDMVPAACWSDDLKSDGLRAMEGWHFINQPYKKGGFIPAHNPVQDDNVANDIMTLDATASDKTGSVNAWEKAFAVANLIHFIGDIHQPLHATELFDTTFPVGDRGGNLFDVTFNGQAMVLHAVWDSVCGKYPTRIPRPLNTTDRAYIEAQAQDIIANVPISPADKATWNSTIMAQESFTAAVNHAYANIVPNQSLEATYTAQCLACANIRLAKAGYRLATELNYIFAAGSEVSGKDILARLEVAKKDIARVKRD